MSFLLFVAGVAAPAQSTQPNILVVVTDDQRHDALGHAGNPIVTTPTIDRLASSGVRFRNAFVTTAICAASRASILSGCYERRHRYSFATPPLGRAFTETSYPGVLRRAGFHTGLIGKLGVRLHAGAAATMFDVLVPMAPPYRGRDGRARHLSDRMTDAALAFLRERPVDRPFCLSLSFNEPHADDPNPEQYVWPADLDGLYDDAAVPVPAHAEPEFFARQPAFLRESMNRDRWFWRFDTPEKRERMTRGYYRMIHGADRALGRVLAELQRLELADDTVVVFTSDNGYFLGERGLAGKWLMYEESIRVPLIVVDPRLPRECHGAVRDELALNVDLAPTVLELAGVEIPDSYQGRSLVPLLHGATPAWRDDFFYEHRTDIDRIPKSEGVRTARWKYARYIEQSPLYEELYDLERDPGEARNLAGEPEAAVELSRLRTRCDQLRAEWQAPLAGELLLVTNADDDSLSVLDPASGALLDTLAVEARPHAVVVSPDRTTAVVSGSGRGAAGDSLCVIDLTGNRLPATIALPASSERRQRPRDLQFLPDSERVLVTGDTDLLIVHLRSRRVERTIDTGAIPHLVVTDRAAHRAFVVAKDSDTVTVFDLATGTKLADLRTGAGAEGLAVHPVRDELWVARAGADTISIIDLASGARVNDLHSRAQPGRVAFTPDGTRAVVTERSGNSVWVFDVERRAAVAEIVLEHAPAAVVIDPQGRFAYVSEPAADRVSVIDLDQRAVVRSMPAGGAPGGLAFVRNR